MVTYRIVEVPNKPADALVVFNAQGAAGYVFVGWFQVPGPGSGYGIFALTA